MISSALLSFGPTLLRVADDGNRIAETESENIPHVQYVRHNSRDARDVRRQIARHSLGRGEEIKWNSKRI